jgi:hypothetical protein
LRADLGELKEQLQGLRDDRDKLERREERLMEQTREMNQISHVSSMFSSLGSTNHSSDGIDLNNSTSYIPREELIEEILNAMQSQMFVILSAPPGSGKTSVLQLLTKKLTNCYFVQLNDAVNATEKLKKITGIDLRDFESIKKIKNQSMVVLLDDAQEQYLDKSFWVGLIKNLKIHCLDIHLKFVIATTYLTRISTGLSPAELIGLSKFTHESFILNKSEANDIFRIRNGDVVFKDFSLFKSILFNECGGNPAMISISVVCLTKHFKLDGNFTESDVLQRYFSSDFIASMHRCFVPLSRWDNVAMELLRSIYVQKEVTSFQDSDLKLIALFIRDGVLEEIGNNKISFTTPMAKRYYSQKMFPFRSKENPGDLLSLIKSTIKLMSAKTLSDLASGRNFPKEAGFQQIFMNCLCQNLTPSTVITSELSAIFPETETSGTYEQISGSLDFYINSDLRWGIELLVNGDKIKEHIDRFSKKGKYEPLNCKDYVVVDFRSSFDGTPTNVSRHEKRVCVFFKERNFTSCSIIVGLGKNVEVISLEN